MSDTTSVEPEKVIEQESLPAPAPTELAGPRSASGRSRRGTVSLIFGIASIVLAPLILLPSPIEWVGYLGLVATLIALLAGRGELRARGEIDRRGRKLAQVGVAMGMLGFLALVALFVLQSAQAVQQSTALLATAKAPPKTFESADLTFSYPGGWQAADTSQKAECKAPAPECLIWLDAPLGDGRLVILRSSDPGVETAEEFDEAFWAAWANQVSGVTLESQAATEIDGHSAVRRAFNQPAPDNPEGRVYFLLSTTMNDEVVYQIMSVAGNADAFSRHRATFDNIVQSLDFKDPSAAQATPAPKQIATATPARPTAKPTSAPKDTPAAVTGQIFEGDGFTLAYPDGWVSVDVELAPMCQEVECVLAISSPDDEIILALQRFETPSNVTAEQLDTAIWAAVEESDPSVKLESREEIEIDQQPAIKRVFRMADPSSPTGQVHLLWVITLKDNILYQFVGASTSAEAFEKALPEVENTLDSWRFAP